MEEYDSKFEASIALSFTIPFDLLMRGIQLRIAAVIMYVSMFVVKCLRSGVLHKQPFAQRVRALSAAPKNLKVILPLSFGQLTEVMGGSGKSRIVWEHLKNCDEPLGGASGLSDGEKTLLRIHLDGASIVPAEVHSESVASCGTRKMLVKLSDGQSIETVIIPSSRGGHCLHAAGL